MSSKRQHGSAGSYVTGYLLSLLFTAIPYYLVVNKTITGNSLVATIIGFAILQMFVQVFFFLHLGRGAKPIYNVVFFAATVGIILVVVGGSIYITDHLHYSMSPTEAVKQIAQGEAISQVENKKTGACRQVKVNHRITIVNGQISPAQTQTQLCDTLTIIKTGGAEATIVFGKYPQVGTYASETSLTTRRSGTSTVTLNQSGTYLFYDQLKPKVTGSFTVNE